MKSQSSSAPPDAELVDDRAAPRIEDLLRMPPGRKRQEGIAWIVAGLASCLAALHETGVVHGGIHPDAVACGPSVQALLAEPPAAPAPDAEDAPRHAGYAAFEQYTDDPAHPCGPWTDVYGLAALAYFLATGSAPPNALARRVRDDCVPLHERESGAYGKAFCDAIDRGLAMPAHVRPQTVAAFAAAMGALPPLRGDEPRPPEAEVTKEPAGVLSAGETMDDPLVPPSAGMVPADDLIMAGPGSQEGAAVDPAGSITPPHAPAGTSTATRWDSQARARRILPVALVIGLLLAGGGYILVRSMAPPASTPEPPRAPALASVPPEPGPQAPPVAQPPVAQPPEAQPLASAENQPAPAESPTASVAPALPPSQDGGMGARAGSAAGAPETAPELADAVPKEPSKGAPVTVRVAVRPWGEVLVNGRSRGISPPLRELSLAPGRYQVTVRNATAGDHRMTLTVAPGRPVSITHAFE
ncbi:hypothetical protein ABE485_01315 [Achromobacter spanius]|uniref:hypothetical protein n=1 Tax=Achromobacter spanius TaxID=217203 RepID=UPI00320A0A24